jgi:hypothetical protein
MASIKQMWEVLKDGACIGSDLDTGFNEYVIAMILCGRESFVEGIDRKPAEFIPVDLDACVRATAALRLCMQGIEEEERRRRGLITNKRANLNYPKATPPIVHRIMRIVRFNYLKRIQRLKLHHATGKQING